MICDVCEMDGARPMVIERLRIGRAFPLVEVVEQHDARAAHPECEFLLLMPRPETDFERQLETWTRRQWFAHRRNLPFNEEPPKSPAELACERFARQCAALEADDE